MDIDESRWHWAEGNRYAAEAIKTLLTLNGGAAVALLAFLKGSDLAPVGGALATFATGALFAALAFGGAYFTQLAYGSGHRSTARRLHLCVFVMFGLAAVAFLVGIWLAWGAITDYRHQAEPIAASPVEPANRASLNTLFPRYSRSMKED